MTDTCDMHAAHWQAADVIWRGLGHQQPQDTSPCGEKGCTAPSGLSATPGDAVTHSLVTLMSKAESWAHSFGWSMKQPGGPCGPSLGS